MRLNLVNRNSKTFIDELNHSWEIVDRLGSYLNERGLTSDEWEKFRNANKDFLRALIELSKLNRLFDFSKN